MNDFSASCKIRHVESNSSAVREVILLSNGFQFAEQQTTPHLPLLITDHTNHRPHYRFLIRPSEDVK